ncbi:MAG: stimulus-sensing domain-containing protein [Hyphomonadaceae bacterium]
MATVSSSSAKLRRRAAGMFGSRIARLILASNLAGLAILIAGAMVLNEMRAGLVVSKKQDLVGQAQIFTNLLGEGATIGQPEPALDIDLARMTIRSLDLPATVRARVALRDGEVIADSVFLSDRVDVSALPPLREPSAVQRWGTSLSSASENLFSAFVPNRGGDAVRTQTYEEEFANALVGVEAASQRFSDRGQRVISVSVPIQRVSAVVGILTLEASDVEEIVRAERRALIPFVGVAMLVALVTSVLLTLGIARPLRRLAVAADRVRTGRSERLDLPQITKRKDEIGQLAQSVDAMTDTLLDRITANEQFAADVAHELKNPLTSIRSAVETAEMVKDDPAATEKLRQVIAKDVQRLDRLITDISNASRLEAEITRSPNALLDIARFVSGIVQTYGDQEGASVSVAFSDQTMGGGLLVRGRDGPLGQVIRNLIDNARSFSPENGEVRVVLHQVAIGPQTTARLTVDDDGPGIPEDKLEKIFDRFYTDRPAGAAFGNNSGLGLSIVKQIIDTHRGTVKALTRDEGGARFIVDLPAE